LTYWPTDEVFVMRVILLTILIFTSAIVFATTRDASYGNFISMDEQTHCLALNIYHESRSESMVGQYAVADVVLNRVASSRYPNTVCGVVKQSRLWDGYPVRDQCQFSWYCDGKPDTPTESDAWHRSQTIATFMIYDDKYRGITEGATHYHTNYVDPYWNSSMVFIGRIGDHLFYKEGR